LVPPALYDCKQGVVYVTRAVAWLSGHCLLRVSRFGRKPATTLFIYSRIRFCPNGSPGDGGGSPTSRGTVRETPEQGDLGINEKGCRTFSADRPTAKNTSSIPPCYGCREGGGCPWVAKKNFLLAGVQLVAGLEWGTPPHLKRPPNL